MTIALPAGGSGERARRVRRAPEGAGGSFGVSGLRKPRDPRRALSAFFGLSFYCSIFIIYIYIYIYIYGSQRRRCSGRRLGARGALGPRPRASHTHTHSTFTPWRLLGHRRIPRRRRNAPRNAVRPGGVTAVRPVVGVLIQGEMCTKEKCCVCTGSF